MRMNIACGSLWVAYTFANRDLVQSMLPSSLELTACPLLDDDRATFPSPKLLFNAYRVDSGIWMQGMRTDVLTLARRQTVGGTSHQRNLAVEATIAVEATLAETPCLGPPACFLVRETLMPCDS